MKESNKCNGVEHVPSCSTWPPAWLKREAAPPATEAPGTEEDEEARREREEERAAIQGEPSLFADAHAPPEPRQRGRRP
jgi:hypothetical protein